MAKPMTKTQLVAALAEAMGSDKKSAAGALDAITGIITSEVSGGGAVTLPGVGKIYCRERPARMVRNPATGEQMQKDAEANAESDKARRALVEVRNQAESLIHSVEKSMTEYGGHIDGADKATIEGDLQSLKDVKDGEDTALIQEKVETLSQSSMKLGEAMYKAQQSEGGDGDAGGQAGGGAADDGVVDADFEEVRDDKKSA